MVLGFGSDRQLGETTPVWLKRESEDESEELSNLLVAAMLRGARETKNDVMFELTANLFLLEKHPLIRELWWKIGSRNSKRTTEAERGEKAE